MNSCLHWIQLPGLVWFSDWFLPIFRVLGTWVKFCTSVSQQQDSNINILFVRLWKCNITKKIKQRELVKKKSYATLLDYSVQSSNTLAVGINTPQKPSQGAALTLMNQKTFLQNAWLLHNIYRSYKIATKTVSSQIQITKGVLR